MVSPCLKSFVIKSPSGESMMSLGLSNDQEVRPGAGCFWREHGRWIGKSGFQGEFHPPARTGKTGAGELSRPVLRPHVSTAVARLFILLAVILQSPAIFLVLSGILWWNVLIPRLNLSTWSTT